MYMLETPVPVAELDPRGELRASAILRLLQLAASRASVAAGFDSAWYAAQGTTWIVRRTDLEIFSPARHDDDLIVHTRVTDFRRVRSLRHYELIRAGDDTRLAAATTDWVYASADNGTPLTPPRAMQEAFMSGGVRTEARPARIRIDGDGASDPSTLRRVERADLDSLGHVNNSRYADFVEQAVLSFLTESTAEHLPAATADLRLARIAMEYLSPSLDRQMLRARVAVNSADPATLDASVEILSGEAAALRARGHWNLSPK